MSITHTVLKLWLDRDPTPNEAMLLEEMMELVIDHGSDSPSAQATTQATVSGQDLLSSVKTGIGTINQHHGGAIEGLVEILRSAEFDANSIVKDYLDSDKRLPGFGHRLYKDQDPRAEALLMRLEELGWDDTFVSKARQLEAALEATKGKKLVLNIDGAMAVVVASLGIDAFIANGFFLWPRVAGLLYRSRLAKVKP